MIGPQTAHAQQLHADKYRGDDETFDDYCVRYARATADSENHFRILLDGLRDQRILPAGRQQLSVGRPYEITAMNCYVGGTIPDTSSGIMEEVKRGMLTLRCGGGDGWNFSTLRPSGDPIRGLGLKAYATGPVSFMEIWDSMCSTVLSAGHRRGAMMGVLRIDHPDIMRFINVKQDKKKLNNFNVSVAVTNEFMEALSRDGTYALRFNGRTYDTVRASTIWARIMERNWDSAEPGILFIDRINEMNPLGYCEDIAATNPCGEQPLPPDGACLLGSINIIKYLTPSWDTHLSNQLHTITSQYKINFEKMRGDIAAIVRAMDNVIDITHYPMHAQKIEATFKRRMGVGVTGMANALETIGHKYGSKSYIKQQSNILKFLRDTCYETSIELSEEKGSFNLFNSEGWLGSGFAQTLPEDTRKAISKKGLRNGLLLSIAPTGTISLCADNVSSGIEPPYKLSQKRLMFMEGEQVEVDLLDYAFREFKTEGRTAYEVTPEQHVAVLCAAQEFIDSAVSKTCNVNGAVGGKKEKGQTTYAEFKDLYLTAYKGGAKGCTTFNINGDRDSIFVEDKEGVACTIDGETGIRSCDG